MKRYNNGNQGAFLLAVLLGALAVFLSDRVEALEQDKQQHIAVSALFGMAAAIALEDTDHPILYGAIVATLPGVVKELYDARHPKNHTASTADLAADVTGAVTGAWLGDHLRIRASRGGVEVKLYGSF
jgi:uncharacterized protein YfiM (DUF2279 family)